mgnify:CR=1 FL=1
MTSPGQDNLLQAVFDASPFGLAVHDASLRFVRINAVLASINGLSVADHLGRTLRDVLPTMAPHVEPVFAKQFQQQPQARDFDPYSQTRITRDQVTHDRLERGSRGKGTETDPDFALFQALDAADRLAKRTVFGCHPANTVDDRATVGRRHGPSMGAIQKGDPQLLLERLDAAAQGRLR